MADEDLPLRYVAPVDPNLGRRVDVYFVLRALLGRGGMGAAYLAEHEALTHVKCVIKLVLAEIARHPTIIGRYKTEAEALSLLKHDGIVKLHGLGVLEDGQLFLRFEYIEGRPLDRYLADHGGRLPLRKAADFIFQLCAALAYAHSRGVVHRDMKPDNVIVEQNPPGSHLTERLKILDFGIAKVAGSAGDATRSGVQMGTPKYMAPEQVTSAAHVTGAADVFSVGQIFFKVVTGETPWGSPENDIAIYHKQRTEPPAWPPEDVMPAAVTKVVHRSLSLNPEDRPTMREFAVELACVIVAERGEDSGTAILARVVPIWVASAPHDAQTLPHPVAAAPPAVSELLANSERGLPPLNVVTVSPKPPAGGPVTAHASPRALAELVAGAAARSASGPATPAVTPALPPFVSAAWRNSPLLAALPTGLASQRFAAQQPRVEPGAPQPAVASEIELASGTPGPQHEHVELPAVLVSTTQLPELKPRAGAPDAQPPRPPEAPPFVMLPRTRARARRKLVLLGAAASGLAAVAVFTVARLAAHDARPPGIVVAAAPGPDAGLAEAPRGDAGVAAATASALAPRSDETIAANAEITASRSPSEPQPAAAGPAAAKARPAARAPSPPAPKLAAKLPDVAASTARPAASLRAAGKPAGSSAAAKPRTGVIIVRVPHTWAQVWIDQVHAGTTPVRAERVPVGAHKVLLVADAHRETVVVTVTAGNESVIERNW
jgi:eukaryotic-like serine/threonine-protein kinase